ncbi:UNVERIFIED_CONTAM: Beta-amyrin 28-monooxygenase [Sesamum latifolium]|uniref:Beta-amyrin 28-monooxygenase n=1 Tax=Sesamum latifolium TaxID=2727402 RepID=A0AAW2VZ06_9LAMI
MDMEIFLPYVIPTLFLLLLPLFLYLISFMPEKSSGNKNLPPGTRGWPVLGENVELARSGWPKFIKDRMEKYSEDVFQTSLLGERMAVFCGAKGNKFLFTNEYKLVTSWLPKSMKKALIFPELLDTDLKQVSAPQRSFHHDILKPEALKQYLPVMDALSREHLEREWTPNAVVKVFPLSKKYTFELACRIFLGVVDPEVIKRLADPFTLAIEGICSMPIDLPGTAYNRAIKGGHLVRQELMRIVKDRRKELMEKNETDLASFDTTSSAVTAVMNYIAELPEIYKEVLEEKMKYSWNVARESFRLIPPAQGAFRETTTEFTYAGYTIPKGWKTFWTVHSSHKNPEYFPEPEKFDPSRFEGSGPPPYTFVPFGGGPRMCPGKEYARLQVLVFMHNVVRRFKLEKVIPNEKIVFHSSPAPVHGLPVRLHPHEK